MDVFDIARDDWFVKLGKREWRANASEINDDVSLSIVGADSNRSEACTLV